MERVRAFVALIAPWLATPGDVRMHPAVVAVVLVLLIAGALTVGYAGIVGLHEALTLHREGSR